MRITDTIRELSVVYIRAVIMVTSVALNVTQVSAHHTVAAFFTGGLLSYIWWKNTQAAAKSTHPLAGHVYAFGAACGTVIGMTIGGMWNGQ